MKGKKEENSDPDYVSSTKSMIALLMIDRTIQNCMESVWCVVELVELFAARRKKENLLIHMVDYLRLILTIYLKI